MRGNTTQRSDLEWKTVNKLSSTPGSRVVLWTAMDSIRIKVNGVGNGTSRSSFLCAGLNGVLRKSHRTRSQGVHGIPIRVRFGSPCKKSEAETVVQGPEATSERTVQC